MKYSDDESYERYKQYQINKYRYEQEQIVFPLAVIAIGSTIICLWQYILIAIAVACTMALIALAVYWYLKKQLTVEQAIVISKDDVVDGVVANVTVTYQASYAKIEIDIPSDVKDNQKLVVKNVVFQDKNGRKIKKNLHLLVKLS